MNTPLISVIMATYNREKTLPRAIDSVLKQSYQNFELLVVDDGSTDNTQDILSSYNDPRIKIFCHKKNKGVTAAKNLGLKNITGEWFTTFDSDDEMVPEALETLINVPHIIDNTITSVESNGWDTSKNCFSGKGLYMDGYLSMNTLINVCRGDFWGISKSDLLKGDSFNENLYGMEDVLWFKVNERAKKYYIHKALLIVHTEGDDRILKKKARFNLQKEISFYKNIIDEDNYLKNLNLYKPKEYLDICKNGVLFTKFAHQEELTKKYLIRIITYNYHSLLIFLLFDSWLLSKAFVIAKALKASAKYFFIDYL